MSLWLVVVAFCLFSSQFALSDAHSIAELIAKGQRDFENRVRASGHHYEKVEHPHLRTCSHHQDSDKLLDERSTLLRNLASRRATFPEPTASSRQKREVTEWTTIRIVTSTDRVNSDPNQCTSVNQIIYLPTGSYNCTADDLVTADLRTLVTDNLVPTAVSVLESLFKVQSVGTYTPFPMFVYSQMTTCGDGKIPIPVEYLENSTGLLGDFWLGVSLQPFPTTSSFIATCATCSYLMDGSCYGRPIAAGANFSPKYIRSVAANAYSYNEFVRAVLHEVTHGLGFTPSLSETGFFRNTAQLFSTSTERGDTVKRFNGSAVTAFAKAHFNCPSLTGFELENNGGIGTAGSHWKLRVALDDYMVGTGGLTPLHITNLTLALMQDIGFYRVNFSQAEVLKWGKDKGCDFATLKCNSGGAWNDPGYYCTTANKYGCTFDRSAFGLCYMTSTVGLPTKYQYFANPQQGGTLNLMDYCPFTYPFANWHCGNASHGTGYYPGSYFGTDSACFVASNTTNTTTRGECFKYQCGSDNSLQVLLVDGWKTCYDGNVVTDANLQVYVQCPLASENFCGAFLSGVPLPPPPEAAPVSPPVAIPMTPPTFPPTAAPTAPPISPPIDAPATPPVSPPIPTPITPPVSPPVTAPLPPPTSIPVAQPIAPPVSPPASPPIPAPVAPPVSPPIAAPITSPVPPPVSSPISPPIASPAAAPLSPPVVVPTSPPMTPPVAAPLHSPTEAPVSPPVEAPSQAPTSAPTAVAPTTSPTASPVLPPTQPPSDTPTASPVSTPLTAPTDAPDDSAVTGTPPMDPISSPTTIQAPSPTPLESPTAGLPLTPTAAPKSPAASPKASPKGSDTSQASLDRVAAFVGLLATLLLTNSVLLLV